MTTPRSWADLASILTPGKKGAAKLEIFEITGKEPVLFRQPFLCPGRYVRLTVGGSVVMSNTPFEERTNREFKQKAKGDVLIAGLGVGMIIVPLLDDPEVTSITVIERNSDVIVLVLPQLRALPGGGKVKVHNADITTWKPAKGELWDTIYFDVWNDVCTDNLPELSRLNRRFCRKVRPDGWMGAWEEHTLRSRKRREDKEEKALSVRGMARLREYDLGSD